MRHHLIDVADPDDAVDAGALPRCCHGALEDVWSRGKLPVLAGGSGQYVWALLEGWQVPRVAPDLALRAELEALAAEGLRVHARLAALDPEAAARLDPNNLRRLIRALEVVRARGCRWRRARRDSRSMRTCWSSACACRVSSSTSASTGARTRSSPRGFVDEVRRLREAGYGETRRCAAASATRRSALPRRRLDLDEALRRTRTPTTASCGAREPGSRRTM